MLDLTPELIERMERNDKEKSSFIFPGMTHTDLHQYFQDKIGQRLHLESQGDSSFKESQEVVIREVYEHFIVVEKEIVKGMQSHTYQVSVNYGSLISGSDIIEFI
jgi:uncharacterized protein Veg